LQLQVYPNASKDEGAAKLMSTPILTVAAAGTWTLDRVHSRVDFHVSYLVGTFKGEFHEIEAELTVDGERASLESTAKVASVDVQDENLSARCNRPTSSTPSGTPSSASLPRTSASTAMAKSLSTASLMIRGVTKPVTVTGTVTAPIAEPYGNDRIGLNLAAKIVRTDFGVDWNNPLPSGEPALANDVTILAELQFVKPAGETS